MPDVFKFSDQYGDRMEIDMIEPHRLPDQLALINDYIIGVIINDGIYPLWSRGRKQVIVHILTATNVVMTSELHARYDRYFTPFNRNPRLQALQHSNGRIPPNHQNEHI